MRNRRVRIGERLAVVRVAVERKQAARVTGTFRELVIEILEKGELNRSNGVGSSQPRGRGRSLSIR